MKNIEMVKILVRAEPGVNIVDCVRDCIILALEKRMDVELIFNDEKHQINYQKVLDDTVNQ